MAHENDDTYSKASKSYSDIHSTKATSFSVKNSRKLLGIINDRKEGLNLYNGKLN